MEKVKIQFISYHTRDYYGWIRYINVKNEAMDLLQRKIHEFLFSFSIGKTL